MQFANDEFGGRVHILKTQLKVNYFCPSCNEKLVLKKGNIRAHHFAHQRSSICTDSWNYEMSLWHINWQNRFPEESQEVVKEHNGKKHRADVLIEETKTVIEFQHSPLSSEEFDDRNHFFNALGYKVIWVFDNVELYENDRIEELRPNVWKWRKPKTTFDNFELKKENVEIFFQLQNEANDNEDVQEYLELVEKDRLINPILDESYHIHKNDKGLLIRITWVGVEGFNRFASDKEMYNNNDFVNSYSNVVKKRAQIHIEDLYDELQFVRNQDHSAYYFGCPISESHLSVNSTIDIHPSEYKRIMPCSLCEYNNQDYTMKCRKSVIDLQIPETATITDYKKIGGLLSEVTYENEGIVVTKKLVPLEMKDIADTIPNLWEKENPSVATFRNIKSGMYVRITKNPIEQLKKYRKCYGTFSSDQYNIRGESKEIYYAEQPYWILIWSKH